MNRSPIVQLILSILAFTTIIVASMGEIYGAAPAPTREQAVPASQVIEREIQRNLTIGQSGISQEIVLQAPAGSRSVALAVQGSDYSVIALASFITSDGVEHIGLPIEGDQGASLTGEMDRRYFEDQVSVMPGKLFQSMRMGTYTLNFPNIAEDVLPEGEIRIRVASTLPGDRLTLKAKFPEDDGADTLLVNLIDVSRGFYGKTLPSMETVRRIYSQIGIKIRLNGIYRMSDLTYSRIFDGYEPQEPPYGASAALARQGGAEIGRTNALNIYLVDELPSGVLGLSLGTPGTWDPSHYFYGVVVRFRPEWRDLGRTIAHEIGHFMGLPHLESRGTSGMVYPDPFDDTTSPQQNLMGKGLEISPRQASLIRRHPLLIKE